MAAAARVFPALRNVHADATIDAAAPFTAGANPVRTLGRARKRTREVVDMALEGRFGVDSQDVGDHALVELNAAAAVGAVPGGAVPGGGAANAAAMQAGFAAVARQIAAVAVQVNANHAAVTAKIDGLCARLNNERIRRSNAASERTSQKGPLDLLQVEQPGGPTAIGAVPGGLPVPREPLGLTDLAGPDIDQYHLHYQEPSFAPGVRPLARRQRALFRFMVE